MGHWMTTTEQDTFGIPTPAVKISSGWETRWYYLDDNGIPWGVDAYNRDDGWTEWRARPSAVATTAAKATKLYGIGAGRFPVSALTATGEDNEDDHKRTREMLSESIDEAAQKKKGGWGWLILLLLAAAAASKRR
jgi:hypothetical protein